jgi:DnaJ-class molecular chaperone
MDLYNVLELQNIATKEDIKKNFKKLALKYHPDKNRNNNKNYNEKFNQIRIAYEILSNPEKKLKYDNMNLSKQQIFIDTLFQFIKKVMDPTTINNIMLRPDVKDDIKDGDINKIASNLIQKILNNIDVDIDVNKLSEVFISKNNNSEDFSILSTPEFNTLNIVGTIDVNIEEVYYEKLKEIIIKRKIYKNNEIINYESNKYNIPLYDNKVIISKGGDKIINEDNEEYGNVILRLNYIIPNNLIKHNYDIIYNDKISMYELFYGFNKKLFYFNTAIHISSNNPLKEYTFNGDYLSIFIKSKGLPHKNNIGDLIINLYLDKNNEFKEKIKLM